MKEQKLPSKGKWAFIKDFERDENGEYIYVGKTYTYDSERLTHFKAMRALCFLNVVIFGSLLGCGMIRAAGILHAISVLFPYAVGIFTSGVLIFKQIELWRGKETLREYTYKSTVAWYDVLLGIVIAAMGIMLIAETVFVIKNGTEGYLWGTIALYVLMLLTLGAAVLQLRFFKTLKWIEHPATRKETEETGA